MHIETNIVFFGDLTGGIKHAPCGADLLPTFRCFLYTDIMQCYSTKVPSLQLLFTHISIYLSIYRMSTHSVIAGSNLASHSQKEKR